MRQHLIDTENWTEEQDQELVQRSHERVDLAIQFARDSEYPAPEEAMEKVFA